MKQNVGGIDKVLRIVVGLGLLSLLFLLEGSAKWYGLIGLVPLGTALMGYCPLYSILGGSKPVAKVVNHQYRICTWKLLYHHALPFIVPVNIA